LAGLLDAVIRRRTGLGRGAADALVEAALAAEFGDVAEYFGTDQSEKGQSRRRSTGVRFDQWTGSKFPRRTMPKKTKAAKNAKKATTTKTANTSTTRRPRAR
jgi:predicted HD phosphohydrolase